MVSHPNRSRLGDLNTLETVKSYLARTVANSDPDLALADIIGSEIDAEDEKIVTFEVEERTICKYRLDSGEYERTDAPTKHGEHVHMRAVVAVIDLGGTYGLSRVPVAYFDAKQGAPNRMANRLNKGLA